LTLLFSFAALLACTAGIPLAQASTPQKKTVPSGTINWGFVSIPTSLSPYSFVSPPQTYFFHGLYDGLTALNPKGAAIPALATSWTHSVHDSTWTFTLRKHVAFTNGEVLSSQGVVADLHYLATTPSLSLYSEAQQFQTITAISPTKVRIVTSSPDPLMLQQLTAIPIPAPAAFIANPAAFATTAIGTGPYMLSSFSSGTSVTLVANPRSWQPQPKTETQTFTAIPVEATRVAALESGQIDIAQTISPDDAANLARAGLKSIAVRRAQIEFAGFEVAQYAGPLANINVRQAMNYAVDIPEIITTILGGVFAPATGQVVNSDGFGWNPKVKQYPYDPTKAKALLAAAGYPNGFNITMEETVGQFPNDQQAYQAVANYLDAVGINVTVNIVPVTQFVTALRAGPRNAIFVEGLQSLPELDTTKAMMWFLCNEPSGPTADRFCDPALDALIKASYSDHNVINRQKALQAANALWNKDAPAIPLWELTDIWGAKSSLKGWVVRHDAVLPLSTITLNG
jgi:peptide/nickel transport system substrate-binding protein